MVSTTTVPTLAGASLDKPYTSAMVLAFFSILVTMLILPALLQHYRNRNIGATILVMTSIAANLEVATNAIIWSNDDMQNWYNGVGLCDIQVKLIIAFYSMFPASVMCILRTLAKVMDTDSATWAQTSAQKRRNYITDLVCCVGIPSLFMALSFITQPVRYNIMGISGCQVSQDGSWLAFLLLFLPPTLWILLCVYYSIVVLVRLIRYRLAFNTILANSNTTKSRFMRLYCLCCLVILALLPLQVFSLIQNQVNDLLPFSWNDTHNNPDLPWNSAVLIPSYGTVFYDRIIWVVGGFVIFLLFGFGKDAMKTYRVLLLSVGLGRIFPVLRSDYQRSVSITGTISSISSKAKIFLKRKEADAEKTLSTSSTITDSTLSPSPKKMTFPESIRKDREAAQEPKMTLHRMRQKSNNPFAGVSAIFTRKPRQPPANDNDDAFARANFTGPNALLSTISADPLSPTATAHARNESRGTHDVLVMKEIRQASETAETLP